MCYSVMVAQEIKSLSKRFGSVLVREDQDLLFERERILQNPVWPILQNRIFSGHFAPIYFMNHENNLERQLMRYSAYPPINMLNDKNTAKLSTFNARRDNILSPFWSSAFLIGHGFIALKKFYEWVKVSDLMAAGVVSLSEVVQYFQDQSSRRKLKFESEGKKWKPTPTELMEPLLRKVVIEFFSEAEQPLYAPVVFNQNAQGHPIFSKGFAILTDDPLPEVLMAGHDRSPAFLDEARLEIWLNPKNHSIKELVGVLGCRGELRLLHQLESLGMKSA